MSTRSGLWLLAACLAAYFAACSASAQTFVGGPVPGDTTWTLAGSPYVVTSTVTVAAGLTLTIEPGVEIQLRSDKGITVFGSFLAQGTESNTISITKYEPDAYGGYLQFNGGSYALTATGVLEHCVVTLLQRAPAVLGSSYAMLTIVDCTFSNMPNSMIIQPLNSRIDLANNVIHNTGEAINARYCAGRIASNIIYDLVGNADAIDVDFIWGGDGEALIEVEYNYLRSGPSYNADGIDFGSASGVARGNFISSFGDKGISVGEFSYPEIYNNYIENCNMGIAIKDGSIPIIENNTIVNCVYGINSYDKSLDGIGGRGTFYNGIIWDCGTSILLQDDSTLDVGYSTIEGGWAGVGNLTNNPLFIDPGSGDYHLQSNSPCINGGRIADWMTDGVDLEGNPRIIYQLVDMGAYEIDVNMPRSIWLLSPRREAIYEIGQVIPITWGAYGPDWTAGDTIALQVSADSGLTWSNIVGASNLQYDQGSFDWHTDSMPESDQYRMKVLYGANPAVADASRGDFALEIPMLDHFDWSTVVSPRIANLPFPVTITAMSMRANPFEAFNGTVSISGWMPSVGDLEVGIGAGTVSWYYPMPVTYSEARLQSIYLDSEIGGACSITGLYLNVMSLPSRQLTNWKIRIRHTSLSSYAASPVWESTGWTVVYQANESVGSTGWYKFIFTTPFAYNGTDNIMIDFLYDRHRSAWSGNGMCEASTTAQNRSIYYRARSSFGNPINWTGTSPPPKQGANLLNLRLLTFAAGTQPISITPVTSGNFVDGIWTGAVTVLGAATNMALTADDGSSHAGDSIFFDVLDSPGNYWLELSTQGSGIVDVVSDWFAIGSNVPVTAYADQFYEFDTWTGDTGGCAVAGDMITVHMDRIRVVGAVFDMMLATNSTPVWWLASYDLTNLDWDTEALFDSDADGAKAWEEYVSGTDPTDPGSRFALRMNQGASVVDFTALRATGTDRIYDLETHTNVAAANWSPLPGYTNIVGNDSVIYWTNTVPDRMRFVRGRVRLK